MNPPMPGVTGIDAGLAAIIAAMVAAFTSFVLWLLERGRQERVAATERMLMAEQQRLETARLAQERQHREKAAEEERQRQEKAAVAERALTVEQQRIETARLIEERVKAAAEEEVRRAWARQASEPAEKAMLAWLISTLPPAEQPGAAGEKTSEGSPYIIGTPIRETRSFYGRKSEVEAFFRTINSGGLPSFLLLGARRTGKTSLLLHVGDPQVWRAWRRENAGVTVPVYINPQAGALTGPDSFWRLAYEATVRALQRAVQGHASAPPIPQSVSFTSYLSLCEHLAPQEQERPGNDLTAAGQEAGSRGQWQLVLLLDEFECLSENPVFVEQFFLNMRHLTQIRTKVAWVLVSYRRPLRLMQNAEASPLSNVLFDPVFVGAMTRQESLRLVGEPAALVAKESFEPGDAEFLIDTAGQLPQALQMAGDCLYVSRGTGKRGQQARDVAASMFKTRYRERFESYWEGFTDAERDALKSIARGKSLPVGTSVAANELLSYGFLGRDGDHCILGTAFREWILEKTK